jgi:hypothetical protein
MREGEDTSAPYTEATRARMVLAAEAAELSDFAAGFVPIGEHELREDGAATFGTEHLYDANRLVTQARRVLEAAAVFTRLGGASWQDIGNALDVTRQSATERFEPAVNQFREALLSPQDPDYTGDFGQLQWRLHSAALDPQGAAQRLDEWAREHADSRDEPRSAPVSNGLARMDPHAELRWLSDQSHQLWKDSGGEVPSREASLRIAEREVTVYERIAAGQKRPSRAVRDGLTYAQQLRARLIAEVAQTTPTTEPAASTE